MVKNTFGAFFYYISAFELASVCFAKSYIQSSVTQTIEKDPDETGSFSMVRAARIELASLAWKAGILAVIRRPRTLLSISNFAILVSVRVIMADLNQFLNQDLTADDVLHSNGYGAVAGGGGAGGLSMEQRRKLLNQPRVVGEYRYSRLGRQASAIKARTADKKTSHAYDASSDSFDDNATFSNRKNNAIKDRSQIDTKSVERRQRFIEPPSRGHDSTHK